MQRWSKYLLPLVLFCGWMSAHAQAPVQTTGTLVIIPAYGEVKAPNDEAHATFTIEEQDKDKAAAASRVNQKMKEGTDILKREDPQASLRTRGYFTYPVYPDEQPRPGNKPRQPVGWRVGHTLEMTTTNLSRLPRTVASVQNILALNGLYFSLTEASGKKLDAKRIEAAYRNLDERIGAIAKAIGRNPSDAVLEMVDLEASGAYAPQQDIQAPKTMRAAAMEAAPVEEPNFEPGESTLGMRIVGKVRFK